MRKKISREGFSLVETLVIVVVLTAVVLCAALAWHAPDKDRPHESGTSQPPSSTSAKSNTTQTTDPYAGWKTLCDRTSRACFKYPSDWVASQYDGLQNVSDTTYVEYEGYDSKDQATGDSYIAQIVDLTSQGHDMKIVGSIDNSVPTYTVYDASDVAGLKVGQTTPLVVENPTFGSGITFIATPGAGGISAIKNMDEAKAWFSTAEAKLCLKVLQSFYYQ